MRHSAIITLISPNGSFRRERTFARAALSDRLWSGAAPLALAWICPCTERSMNLRSSPVTAFAQKIAFLWPEAENPKPRHPRQA